MNPYQSPQPCVEPVERNSFSWLTCEMLSLNLVILACYSSVFADAIRKDNQLTTGDVDVLYDDVLTISLVYLGLGCIIWLGNWLYPAKVNPFGNDLFDSPRRK